MRNEVLILRGGGLSNACSLAERSHVKETRGLDWLIWKDTPTFTRIFVSTVVFVTHTDLNDDLCLNVTNALT